MAAAPPKVELRNVNLRYFGLEGETEALKDVSMSITPVAPGKSRTLSICRSISTPRGASFTWT